MNQRGFTLLETLISLSLLTIFTAIPLLAFSEAKQHYESSYHAWQLKQDFMIAQHVAMARGEMVSLRSYSDHYLIRLGDHSTFLRRSYSSDDMELFPVSYTAQFVSFNRNGNPRNAGTLLFRSHGKEYMYVIQIGKGRIRYSEF